MYEAKQPGTLHYSDSASGLGKDKVLSRNVVSISQQIRKYLATLVETTILIGDGNAMVGLKIGKEEIPRLANETPLSASIFFLQDKTKFVS